MHNIVPVHEASKRGVAAVGGIAGGILLFILGSLSPVAGIIAGAAALLLGVAALGSKDPRDKFPGFITAGAGALAVAANLPFIRLLLRGPAKFLLGLGAAALFVTGIWNLFKFLQSMKSRS